MRDNDGDTHHEKVSGATSFNPQHLEHINRTSQKQAAAKLQGLMQVINSKSAVLRCEYFFNGGERQGKKQMLITRI